jgi:hypothetical protein
MLSADVGGKCGQGQTDGEQENDGGKCKLHGCTPQKTDLMWQNIRVLPLRSWRALRETGFKA